MPIEGDERAILLDLRWLGSPGCMGSSFRIEAAAGRTIKGVGGGLVVYERWCYAHGLDIAWSRPQTGLSQQCGM